MGCARCVLFDRDGIVNESPGAGYYVQRWEDFRLQPAFVAALRVVRDRGYQAVIVTNQRGVALGLVAPEELARMHELLRASLRSQGVDVLDILVCTHHEGACDCRKPRPGLLLEAARRHGLDLAASWMVGDQETDVQAGRQAGCRTIRVAPPGEITSADYRVADMNELVTFLARVLDRPASGGEESPTARTRA